MGPLVSVVVPTYNRTGYLKAAITSVLAQTYGNFELLVLDNCSSDGTTELVASFNDVRIKYVRHLCNIGPIANWTYGVYLAKGEYLCVLGDDDYYAPCFLEKRVAALGQIPEILCAFAPFEYLYEETGTKSPGGALRNGGCDQLLIGARCLDAALSVQFVGASMYRTEAVRAHWPEAITGGNCIDTTLNILLALREGSQFAYLSQPDSVYRRHSSQFSQAFLTTVAEDGGNVYLNLMRRCEDREVRKIFKKYLAEHWNRNARICWDNGEIAFSRRYFLNELKLTPTRGMTWLRLARCCFGRPAHSPDRNGQCRG